jgi:TonB family protein
MKRAAIILCILTSLAFQSPQATQKPEAEPCYCASSSDSGIPYGLPNDGRPEPPCSSLKVAYRQKDVDKKAVLKERPEPTFTQEAKDNHTSGVVRLRVVLCPSGKLSNITVIKGLPDGLTEKAIVAARGIKFAPAEKDGEKVAQFLLIEYYFAP